MPIPDELTNEQLLYNAVLYLAQTGRTEAAETLILCEMDEWKVERENYDAFGELLYTDKAFVTLSAPPPIRDRLEQNEPLVDEEDGSQYFGNVIREKIADAFKAVLRQNIVYVHTHPRLVSEIEGDWRQQIATLLRGEKVTNQGVPRRPDTPVFVWNNLNFWSPAEREIAKALEKPGVLYLPNCMTRLGPPEHRYNKETDFVVCCEGKWGILEVDGKAFHQIAAQDYERDRQFARYGIRIIQRFTGKRCMENPDEVVETFLDILKRNG
jgi:hypothetical protein